MNILDYPGLLFFLLLAVVVGYLMYKDSKSAKPLQNMGKIHTITQGVNLHSEQFDRDNQALDDFANEIRTEQGNDLLN